MRLLLLLLCLGLFWGCAQTPKTGFSTLEKAYANQPSSAREWALAGHYAWLSADNPQEAQTFFQKALSKQKDEPWALYGLLMLAYHQLQHPQLAEYALRLLEAHPSHPLANAAAYSLSQMAGLSPHLDNTLFERLLPLQLADEAAALQADILADIAYRQGAFEKTRLLLANSGKPTAWSLIGPLFPSRLLSFAEPLPLESTGDLRKLPDNAQGPVPLRTLSTPHGLSHIPHEGNAGEMYVLATDVEIHHPGTYALRIFWHESFLLFVNQQQLLSSLHFPVLGPRLHTLHLHLQPGVHRFMLRSPSTQPHPHVDFRLSFVHSPQNPNPNPYTPPSFRPAQGGAPQPLPTPLKANPSFPGNALFQNLRQEAGEGLAAFVTAHLYASKDANQAKRFLALLPPHLASSPLCLLRAETEAADTLTFETQARGKISRELEKARHKSPRAALLNLRLSLSENRPADAEQLLQEAQQHFSPTPPEFQLENARLYSQLGLEAEAQKIAEHLSSSFGMCSASLLSHQLALQYGAAQTALSSLNALASCPPALSSLMAFLASQGEWEKLLHILERLQTEDESKSAPLLEEYTRVLVALHRFEEALQFLKNAETKWPYKASIPYLMADVYEALQQPQQALQARQQALSLIPYDLGLQRLVQRSLSGKELLEEFAISTEEALQAYAASERAEASDTAYVLDASVMRFFEDGSMVERTHIIEKAFSQRGVARAAEVDIPPGAIPLKLRTLKADGSILEPESIEHKNTISMPAVEPGDMVEVEYLNAYPPRSLLYPGFASPAFFYQIPFKPNSWSTLTLLVPKTFNLQVDAHHLLPKPPQLLNNELLFHHEEKNLPAFEIPPQSPPSQMEWLPFLNVGANPGYEDFIAATADRNLELGQASFEVAQFARNAAANKQGIAAVEAVYNAVHQHVAEGNNMQTSAAASLDNASGSRFWLLYAALKSLGFNVRAVASTTLFSPPQNLLFPPPNNLGYWCLKVQLKGLPTLWLDASTRFLPFGSLPEYAQKQTAYVLPEPGAPFETALLPETNPSSRTASFNLHLDAHGNLSGSAEEVYSGFIAAKLTENFALLPAEQQHFKIQDSVSEQFPGANLSNIEILPAKAPGENFVIRYQLQAPHFASKTQPNRWLLPHLTPLQNLGQRYATSGSRKTPLFIPSPENIKTSLSLSLPENFSLYEPVASKQILSPWGNYVRYETSNKNLFSLEENFQLTQGRILPENYEQFVGFAGEVDLFQAHEFILISNP